MPVTTRSSRKFAPQTPVSSSNDTSAPPPRSNAREKCSRGSTQTSASTIQPSSNPDSPPAYATKAVSKKHTQVRRQRASPPSDQKQTDTPSIPAISPSSKQAQTSTPPASSPAAHEVFHINELFQEILLGLDMKTLLLSQRVSTHWRANIIDSTLLQKKLFLQPATFEELSRLNLIEESDLVDGLPEDSSAEVRTWISLAPKTHNASKVDHGVAVHNALLVERPIFSVNTIDTLRLRQTMARGGQGQPSWERMLLVQPPPPTLTLSLRERKFFWGSTIQVEGIALWGKILADAETKGNGVVEWASDYHVSARRPVVVLGRDGRVNNAVVQIAATPIGVEELAEMEFVVLKK